MQKGLNQIAQEKRSFYCFKKETEGPFLSLPPSMATAKQKRGTSGSLLPPRPMVETPGFDGLQIGERTPKRTRTVNRKCYATRGRGDVQGCGDRGGMRGVSGG
ncbi:hypothetical protein ERO13_A06G172700v2 [Gossypium hirsutum]|nr:hypothetical protein ERO13_A06G172700v2 [Gossypium hirsutum]